MEYETATLVIAAIIIFGMAASIAVAAVKGK
jgi:hypothetical protein